MLAQKLAMKIARLVLFFENSSGKLLAVRPYRKFATGGSRFCRLYYLFEGLK